MSALAFLRAVSILWRTESTDPLCYALASSAMILGASALALAGLNSLLNPKLEASAELFFFKLYAFICAYSSLFFVLIILVVGNEVFNTCQLRDITGLHMIR